MLIYIIAVILIVLFVLISVLIFSDMKWKRETLELGQSLIKGTPGKSQKRVSFDKLEGLPEPVQNYFKLVLKDGQPIIKAAKIKQSGLFNLKKDEEDWKPFNALHLATHFPPGFMWDAKIKMAGPLHIRVRDGYSNGKGMMNAKVMSLINVANAESREELIKAAMQRYLAEAVWYPTALLPDEKLKWTAIDEKRALAELSDYGFTVSVEFRFNSNGEINGIYSPERFYEENGSYTLQKWGGFHSSYKEINGMLIPTEGKVEWYLESDKYTYWKGTIDDIEFEFYQ